MADKTLCGRSSREMIERLDWLPATISCTVCVGVLGLSLFIRNVDIGLNVD